MLDAASAVIGRMGLTVSLEHISFEDVIRQAGVARSAVYRRWPYKDLFFSDLLLELARATRPATATGFESTVDALREAALVHLDWLETAELRHQLVLELIRLGAQGDFEAMVGSTEWRTYLALHATFLSIADDGLRRSLESALTESERGFTSRIAESWELLAGLFGYRLRPESGAGFDTIATLASASLRGLVLTALSTPEVAAQRFPARPFGAAQPAEWSAAALGAASIASAFLEPDPAIEWTPNGSRRSPACSRRCGSQRRRAEGTEAGDTRDEPGGMLWAMEQRISLVTLGVSDLARARAFYESLGWRGAQQPDEEVCFFQAGTMVFGLWTALGGHGAPGIELAHNVCTPAEVEALLAAAERAGATIVRPAEPADWGGTTGAFADPDGYVWEVAHNPGWTLTEDGAVRI